MLIGIIYILFLFLSIILKEKINCLLRSLPKSFESEVPYQVDPIIGVGFISVECLHSLILIKAQSLNKRRSDFASYRNTFFDFSPKRFVNASIYSITLCLPVLPLSVFENKSTHFFTFSLICGNRSIRLPRYWETVLCSTPYLMSIF